MDTELFALRHRRRAPDTAGEWIALILAITASVAVDTLLKKNFPDMAPRVRKGLSSIPTFAILLIYFFVIKK